MADSASGFGATAETNANNKRINELLDQVRDLLVEDGNDYATAEALTNFARRGEPTIVGNLADLQRMGAIIVSGEIPAMAMPTGDQAPIETSNIEDAFAEPPAPNLAAAGLQTPIAQVDDDGNPKGDGGEGGSSLESMNKAELQAEADSRGVEYSSSDTKAELIAKLS